MGLTFSASELIAFKNK